MASVEIFHLSRFDSSSGFAKAPAGHHPVVINGLRLATDQYQEFCRAYRSRLAYEQHEATKWVTDIRYHMALVKRVQELLSRVSELVGLFVYLLSPGAQIIGWLREAARSVMVTLKLVDGSLRQLSAASAGLDDVNDLTSLDDRLLRHRAFLEKCPALSDEDMRHKEILETLNLSSVAGAGAVTNLEELLIDLWTLADVSESFCLRLLSSLDSDGKCVCPEEELLAALRPLARDVRTALKRSTMENATEILASYLGRRVLQAPRVDFVVDVNLNSGPGSPGHDFTNVVLCEVTGKMELFDSLCLGAITDLERKNPLLARVCVIAKDDLKNRSEGFQCLRDYCAKKEIEIVEVAEAFVPRSELGPGDTFSGVVKDHGDSHGLGIVDRDGRLIPANIEGLRVHPFVSSAKEHPQQEHRLVAVGCHAQILRRTVKELRATDGLGNLVFVGSSNDRVFPVISVDIAIDGRSIRSSPDDETSRLYRRCGDIYPDARLSALGGLAPGLIVETSGTVEGKLINPSAQPGQKTVSVWAFDDRHEHFTPLGDLASECSEVAGEVGEANAVLPLGEEARFVVEVLSEVALKNPGVWFAWFQMETCAGIEELRWLVNLLNELNRRDPRIANILSYVFEMEEKRLGGSDPAKSRFESLLREADSISPKRRQGGSKAVAGSASDSS